MKIMKSTDFPISSMNENNYYRKCDEDVRTNPPVKSTDENPQCEESSSIDWDSRQTKEALSQIDLSKFPDGTRVVQVQPCVVLDIPDSFLEQYRDSHASKSEHKSYIEEGYLSEKHRKEQLAFLNGR